MVSNDDLKAAIIDFLGDFSIEATPNDTGKLDQLKDELKPGTAVYVAHPPGVPIDDVVELAGRIKTLGLTPVPHIIARKLSSREQLERALERLRGFEVDEALVVGGDEPVPDNAFDGSLEVLQTGLFDQYGFKAVGVAGHPEGSKAIGAERVEQALTGKAAFAKSAGFQVRLVTQFGFDPEAVTSWERELGERGIMLPIHVGVAGPASLRQLVRFAMLCGVGASAKMLTKRTGATANLLKTQAPDAMITRLAEHRANDPSSRLQKVHFFAFGGIVKTAQWANQVISGRFELNAAATGFDV